MSHRLESNGSTMRHRPSCYLLWLVLGPFIALISNHASADTPIVSLGDAASIEFSNQTEIFLDDSRELIFQDVSQGNFTGFKRNMVLHPSFGNYSGRAWFRFTLENTSKEPVTQVILFTASVLSAHLYFSDKNGEVQDLKAGRDFNTDDERLSNRFPSFPVRLEPNQPQTFYLAVQSDIVYATKLSLNTYEEFFAVERMGNYLTGVVTGIMIVMILYNFFLYLSTRDITFLWYVLTVLTLHLIFIAGSFSGGEFFGMRLPYLSHYVSIVAKIVGAGFLVQFSRVFLHTKDSPKFDFFLKICLASGPVFLLFMPFVPLARLNAINNLFFVPSILTVIAYSANLLIKGYSYARFYFIAWFPFFLTGLVAMGFNMTGQGHLAPNISIYLVVAACAEVLLLSMALGDKINHIKREKEQVYAVHRAEILTMNRALEAKVKEKTRDIRSMLDNLKLGIFTIDSNMTLSSDYSKYLATIVEPEIIESRSAAQILFDHALVGDDLRNQVETVISSSIGTDDLSFYGNEHLLLRHLQKQVGDHIKDYEIDWTPMEDDEGKVERILVAMKDVTEFSVLKRKNAEQSQQLELMTQYMSADRAQLHVLEQDLKQLVLALRMTIDTHTHKKAPQPNASFIDRVFSQFHTLKAMSRKLKLAYLSDHIHLGEEYLHQLRAGECELSHPKLRDLADGIEACLGQYHLALDAFGLKQTVLHGKTAESALEEVIADILAERVPLARELNKPIPSVNLDFLDHVELHVGMNRALESALLHLVRNSMDHGIEAAAERLAAAKNERGQISVSFAQNQGVNELIYRDDGRGLHLDRVYQKAQMKSLIQPTTQLTKEQVAELIFRSGFSIKESVSEISGRGIGLNAAAHDIRDAGGDFTIKLVEKLEEGRWGRWSIAFIMSWPMNASLAHKPQESALVS